MTSMEINIPTSMGSTTPASPGPQLPAEVILQIAQYCDTDTLASFSQISKGVYNLLRDELWKTVTFTVGDFERHKEANKDEDATKATQKATFKDVVKYFVGGCRQRLCTTCPDESTGSAPRWQIDLVEELVFDFWQWHTARADRQWANDAVSIHMCMELVTAFPNVKRIGWRHHVVPILDTENIPIFTEEKFASLEFYFDPLHPALPSVWTMSDENLKVIRPDPTQCANFASCDFLKLRIAEFHPCQCAFLAYSVRKMQLRSLSIECDSGATGLLMDRSKVQHKATGGDPKGPWHPRKLTSAIQIFLRELSTPAAGASRQGPRQQFPDQLEYLTLQDTMKAKDVDLDLLAKTLIGCKNLRTLRLVGFPADAVPIVLQKVEDLRQNACKAVEDLQ